MKNHQLPALALAGALLFSLAGPARAVEKETAIALSDSGITVDGKAVSTDPTAAVYTGADIVYYQDGTNESYGQGTESEKHPAAEAQAHTVVTITQPGTYRLTGSLSAGQIAVDLGKEAKDDPTAIVTLILDGVDVTCTVAPALIFYNVYECDRAFVSYDNGENPDYEATPYVDTTAAGANVVLAAGSENTFTGSHVARIYKEGTTKKLHKYDGAFYSKMSMNLSGEGILNIIADNEGLDSELHLTINGGTINIESQDDGINTNEDFVSVTTVNGGSLNITAGLGSEGDGIDSNGYLVLNGGTVITSAHPGADGGIDADSPILINGGTLSAFGGRNDAADSENSAQPYMELSFASALPAGSVIKLTDETETVLWTATLTRQAQSVTLTTPDLKLDTTYHLYVDDVLQCWNGNSFGMMGHGGFGGRFDGQQPPEPPQDGSFPDGRDPQKADLPGQMPSQDFDPAQRGDRRPQDMRDGDLADRPEGFDPGRQEGLPGFGGEAADGSGSTDFVLTGTTKSFSGVCDSDASGKTRVSFAVDGATRNGRTTEIKAITAITPSVDIDPTQVQITVTDDPSESYVAACLLSDGLEAVNALLPTGDGSYTLTVAVVSGSPGHTGATQLSFAVGALPYVDIREGDEGYAAIRALYAAGAMTGTSENTFSPNMPVTRAQAVTALARLSGAQETGAGTFSDVAPNAWYAGYAAWAADLGILEGDGQGRFLPDKTVTAEELTLMLERLDKNYVNSTSFSGELTRSQMAQMLVNIM